MTTTVGDTKPWIYNKPCHHSTRHEAVSLILSDLTVLNTSSKFLDVNAFTLLSRIASDRVRLGGEGTNFSELRSPKRAERPIYSFLLLRTNIQIKYVLCRLLRTLTATYSHPNRHRQLALGLSANKRPHLTLLTLCRLRR